MSHAVHGLILMILCVRDDCSPEVNFGRFVCACEASASTTAYEQCIADRIAEVERGHRQHISNDEGMLSQSQCIEELLVLLHTGGGTEAAFRQALTACRKGRVP